eukprot:277713_1
MYLTNVRQLNEPLNVQKEEIKYNDNTVNFIEPKSSDYIACGQEEHTIERCNVTNRIIHMLYFYTQQQITLTSQSLNIVPVYEYLSALPNYDVSIFMEDWHKCKTNHLRFPEDLKWMQNQELIQCNAQIKCGCNHRYQIERGNETYHNNTQFDHKNMILNDQLDSIHNFIFHSAKQSGSKRNIDDTHTEEEEKYTYEPDEKTDLWASKPMSIKECNLKQILFILNNDMFDDKIKEYQTKIIGYIESHKFDGQKLSEIKRKQFMIEISAYLDNKKLKLSLGKLYKSIMEYDLSKFTGVAQKESMSAKSKFVTAAVNENVSQKQYYSFGTQYRYTKDLKFHPLHVVPRYTSLKEEFGHYLSQIHSASDKIMLLHTQLETVRSMSINPQVQSFLKRLLEFDIKENIETEEYTKDDYRKEEQLLQTEKYLLWVDDEFEQKYENEFILSIEKENRNSQMLSDILIWLFQHCSTFSGFTNFTLHHLLSIEYAKLDQIIVNPLKIYWQTANRAQIQTYLTQYIIKNQSEDILQIVNSIYDQIDSNDLELYSLKNVMQDRLEKYNEEFRRFMRSREKQMQSSKKKIQEPNEKKQAGAPLTEEQKQIQIHELEMQYTYKSVYEIMKITTQQFYETTLERKLQKFPSVQLLCEAWLRGENEPQPLATDAKQISDAMRDIFGYTIDYSNIENVRNAFTKYAMDKIRKYIEDNRNNYVTFQQHERLQCFIEKMQFKMTMQSVKQLKACQYQQMNITHQIPLNEPIKREHVLSLILYTDNSEWCTAFRETYRKQVASESLQEQKLRHATFANMGKLLYESFIFYGSKSSEVSELYHGMSIQLLFKTLYCTFDAPTSTTIESSVAGSFCNDRGIIMKLETSDSSQYIKTLDMSLFSRFDHESEHLIFETRLHIKDIFIPDTRGSVWVGNKIIQQLSLYDLLIKGNTIHSKYLLKKKTQKGLHKMLTSMMDGKISTYTRSDYGNALIESITAQQDKIWLNIEQLIALNEPLKSMFLQDDDKFGSLIQYLKANFNVIICPLFTMNWSMNQHTFELISRASDNKYDSTDVNIIGPIMKCSLSDQKQIVFQPQLSKIQQSFYVQMKLVQSYRQLPVKVHFNIESTVNNFHTSLHPRLMDVKWNNTFYITLPSIDREAIQSDNVMQCCGCWSKSQSISFEEKTEVATLTQEPMEEITNPSEAISIKMSAMIHNFDAFKVDIHDLTAANVTLTADMTSSTQSYAFPDLLSNFYGISNSIVSILDSISDVAFIVFLAFFANIDQNEDDSQLVKSTTHFLIILCTGNLISVAIIIAWYMTMRTEVKSKLQRIFLCFLFFVASPCLPAVEWLLHRFKRHSVDVVVVAPECDGILLWFQQEWIRNKIFVMECIMESCFQIIVQSFAVFALPGIASTNIYLFLSILISVTVIISKLILLSYNTKHAIIFANVLCYAMDVFFSLIFGIFICCVSQKIFTFIGIYMIVELLAFIPWF